MGVLFLALLADGVHGQTLNLDAPVPPAPGTGLRATALVEAANDEILARSRERASPSADASVELRIAIRVLAHNLLRAGESAGEPGSAQFLAGQTILVRLAGLDRRIRAQLPELEGPIAADLVARWTLPPEKLPVDPESLQRFLRDSLAPLVVKTDLDARLDRQIAAGQPASMTVAPLMMVESSLEDFARAGNLDATVVEACRVLDLRIAMAGEWPAYAMSLETVRANAVDALWLLTAPPAAGVPRAMIVDLSRRFGESVQALTAVGPADALPRPDDSAAVGSRSLRVLAIAARSIEMCTRIEPEKSARAVLEAMLRMLAGRGAIASAPGEIARDIALVDRLGRIERLLRSMVGTTPRGDLVTMDDVLRQLRPAIKPLEDARRQAAGDLLEACARAVQSPDVISDPGFLQSATLYRQRLEDLMRAQRVTAAIGHRPSKPGAAAQPVLRDEHERLGERLLLLSRGLTSPRESAEASVQWRAFADAVEMLGPSAGETFLRGVLAGTQEDPAGATAKVTSDRAADLLARLDEARQAWNDQARRARQIESEGLIAAAADLRASSSAVELAAQWSIWLRSLPAAADPMVPSTDAGTALSSWELSAFASRVLMEADLASVAAGLVLAAEGKRAEFTARSWERPSARVRGLAADVAARAHLRGVRALSDESLDAIRQLGLGPADPDRMPSASIRGELLSMSRYLEELAGAMDAGETQAQGALENYLATRRLAVESAVAAWGN